jgi:hypothetical protein
MTRARMVRLLVAALLAALVVPLAGEPASADLKRYPASMCIHWAGPRPALNFSSILATKPPCSHPSGCPDADRENINHVDCPIVKDNPFVGTNRVEVVVIDRHPALDVACSVTSAAWNGSAFLTASDVRSSAGAGGQPQTLSFGRQLPALPSGTEAHWYISCAIPPGSSVVSYLIDELNE